MTKNQKKSSRKNMLNRKTVKFLEQVNSNKTIARKMLSTHMKQATTTVKRSAGRGE